MDSDSVINNIKRGDNIMGRITANREILGGKPSMKGTSSVRKEILVEDKQRNRVSSVGTKY